MTELAIFSFGAVMFAMTTWATLVFFMRRFQEAHMQELQAAGVRIKDQGSFTELHARGVPNED